MGMQGLPQTKLDEYLEFLYPDRAIEVLTDLHAQEQDPARQHALELSLAAQHKRRADYASERDVLAPIVARGEATPNVMARYGQAMISAGQIEAGLAWTRKAFELEPLPIAMTTWLFFSSRQNPAPDDLIAMHFRYGEVVGGGVHTFRRSAQRGRLKVAYVSGDFRTHSITSFIAPVLRHHDPDKVDVYCLMSGPEDFVSERLRQSAPIFWYSIKGWAPEKVHGLIRSLGIDILVDLSGHTAFNQLPVFGMRAAPVQISWLAYMLTTGVKEMDYRFTDGGLVDAASHGNYTEEIYHLPRTTAVWESLLPVEPIAPPPSIANGYATFAVLGMSSKITQQAVDAWVELLGSVPDARLLVLATNTKGAEIDELAARFPIDIRPRIDITPRLGMADFLRLFAQIDIILDTFPVTGGTNTLYALRNGVPTITLRVSGEMNGVGGELLVHMGCPELVAANVTEYVTIAVDLAGSPARLIDYRTSLPALLDKAALSDYAGFASDLEDAYQIMYRRAVVDGRIVESA
jgi:predicted O-linked N-acetylglucosamine transferase (SPINDLY family)